ncbi:serine/threonine-protein kinase [Embleya scabrispora]|uniref:serine/threonine-protein kinase n=1 Tax=Embleya scabrispora TaxID=159449 RepID=UPI00036152A6|nr:serine/threonine-protein kinase [Embleya scabrispora]MYS86912.1 protein kinase [Streptomyces sp. SID5474]
MTALPRRIRRPLPRSGGILDGRYRLGQLLGAGGTADVFRAVDLRLRREVAVKIFQPGTCAVTAERFCQEAVLLGRLTHPALVTVHDVGWHESCTYVVMRLIRGVTLREHILDGPLTSDRVARLGVRLASALEHVHAAGIVHRDVKPSNVLIGPGDAAYLADFGVSRLVDEPTRSTPGTIVGTIPYLAPEQILGQGSGPACDVHALGLVLLEALKGEREYPGASLDAALTRSLRSPHIPSYVPGELASVIEAMTRTDPAARPGAADCVRLLEAAASSTPTSGAPRVPEATTRHASVGEVSASASASTLAASGTKVVRRRRHRLLTTGVVAGIILGATGATMAVLDNHAAPDADNSRPAPTTEPLPPSTQSLPPPAATPTTASTPTPSALPTRAIAPPPPRGTTPFVDNQVSSPTGDESPTRGSNSKEPKIDPKTKEKKNKSGEPPDKAEK